MSDTRKPLTPEEIKALMDEGLELRAAISKRIEPMKQQFRYWSDESSESAYALGKRDGSAEGYAAGFAECREAVEKLLKSGKGAHTFGHDLIPVVRALVPKEGGTP
jgi:flagellar biosynthesis/type III secretory pathway protein FliH